MFRPSKNIITALLELKSSIDRRKYMKNVMPKDDSLWTHIVTKKVYKVICTSNTTATKRNWVSTVVYEDERGNIWSRPIEEFLARMK